MKAAFATATENVSNNTIIGRKPRVLRIDSHETTAVENNVENTVSAETPKRRRGHPRKNVSTEQASWGTAGSTAPNGSPDSTDQPEMSKTQKKTYFMVDPRLIDVDHTINIRKDYGDIDELKDSIIENGVQRPLVGVPLENGRYKLIDGFRRMAAVQLAIEQGHDIKRVPLIPADANMREEDMLLAMYLQNDGKRFTLLEDGELFLRLTKRGFSAAEIATKIARPVSYVSQMIRLAKVPKAIKQHLIDNEISAYEILDLLATVKGDKRLREIVESAIEIAKEKGKSKATRSDILAVSREMVDTKMTPLRKIELLLSHSIENGIPERVDTLQFLVDSLRNKASFDEMIAYFKHD